jgi:(2Fe-2S) ferredoxin
MSKDQIKEYDAHLFICTNEKDGKECCGGRGKKLREAMKEISKDPNRGWKGRVRVNNSGCLDLCKRGVAAVLYPEGRWFSDLEADDTEILTQAIEETLKKSQTNRQN